MIEAVAAILGLFSVGLFAAHAVDAYRAPRKQAIAPSVPAKFHERRIE
jgi:hypothetical protein